MGAKKSLATPLRRLLAWLDMHLIDHGLVRSVYNNFYDLGSGLYRCSNPNPWQIRKYHKQYGIRSIINLRGEHSYGSYAYEEETCRALGITLHNVRLYSRKAPTVAEVHAMRDLFATLEYPALMHCKSGADRAGMGAALYRILHLGHPVEAAMAELDWKYGHFKQAKTGVLDFFLASYLRDNARRPMPFLEWVETVYDHSTLCNQFYADGWASLLVDKVLHRE